MERRGFLRLFGMALAGAVISPSIAFGDQLPTKAAPVKEELPTIDIRLHSKEVRCTTMKLRCQWTRETAEDLKVYHSLKAETELIAFMNQHLEDYGIAA